MENVAIPGTDNQIQLRASTGNTFAIVPYSLRTEAASVNCSFNPYGGIAGNIGLWRYSDDAGSCWQFHPVTFDLTTNISGGSIILSDGDYTYTASPTLNAYVDGSATPSFWIEDSNYVYAWAYSSLPAGVSVSSSGNTLTIHCTSYSSGSVTLTCTVTNTQTGVSSVAVTQSVSLYRSYPVSTLSELESIASTGDYYYLTNDIDASTLSGSISNFSGILDGQYHKIIGLNHPLFERLSGTTVKNLVFDNVRLTAPITVNSIQCLGAIAGYAEGNSKIYNCGILSKMGLSSVSGGDNTGSLVGYITGNTRVVNNYSYANVSGNEYVGGMVGRVAGTALSNDNFSTNGHCAVTNNMFYGTRSGMAHVSPIYAGNHTSNVQNTNEYNYWRGRASASYNYTDYNDQLAIDKDAFLNRFPFYRHIMNTHRELASIYLFGSYSAENVAEIGHWHNVKNDNDIPYPVIEPWVSNTRRTTVDIAANLPNTTAKYAGKLLSDIVADGYYTSNGTPVATMGINGYLAVTVNIGAHSYTTQLPITDMDTLNNDFTWGKVVLPFANEYSGWKHDYSKICTGWKIMAITGGTAGSLTNYNFTDRECTEKDLYSNSNYIFAQGGNYIVPYGVTAITIEAHFANAYYLSDAYYDHSYDIDYTRASSTNLTLATPITYHGQPVYNNLESLLDIMPSQALPHTQAIVLVGNYHYNQIWLPGEHVGSHYGKGFTLMSIDEDCNQEPDYGWYTYHLNPRTRIPPIRIDFVPIIGIGMAARTTGSTPMPTLGIVMSAGWFELTETCVSFMSECEINTNLVTADDDGLGNNRWIANSGYFIQIVRARSGNCNRLSYLQIGGNAFVEQLYPGSHTEKNYEVTLRPILVTGGEIQDCFMTGCNASATAAGSNIYFYAAGGKIHKYLSAYLEHPTTSGVNVTAKVNHARIYRFFGGGTSPTARITGDIDIAMNNSYVDFYCGGPEFGDMEPGRTITTNAIGSTFKEYYGAGFGGTATTYRITDNQSKQNFGNATVPFPLAWNANNYKRLAIESLGIGTCYDFEFILYSGGSGLGVARFYTGYTDFSLAKTGNVTNMLKYCTVQGNYYGAGCQGSVEGNVTSTLINCTLKQNAFGGGYKAHSNEVPVYPNTPQPTYSVYDKETGLFSSFGTVQPEIYTWQTGPAASHDEPNKILYTTTDMSQLGLVSGAISINIKGGTVGMSVFGGGNESPSGSNTTVVIEGDVEIAGNVYGGGNAAPVAGSTYVQIGN